MNANAQAKVEKILKGELKYSSSNLAFNMLITKLKKRVNENPDTLEDCMKEMDDFLAKYPIVAKVDLANIAAL